MSKRTTILLIIGLPIMLFVVFKFANAFSFIPSRQITISTSFNQADTVSDNLGFVGWDFENKLKEGRALLTDIKLKVGSKEYEYTEKRIIVDSGSIKFVDKKLKDAEREIGLVLLDKISGDLKKLIIIKRGAEIITPEGFKIDIVERQNGIRWNYWATQYKVVAPENHMVLVNAWPEKETIREKRTITSKTGKKSTIYQNVEVVKNIIYAPYSEDFHVPEMVAMGDKYIESMVAEAFATLRKNGVYSLAYKNKYVSDVPVLSPDFFYKIPITEHSDLGEFTLDPKKTSERVKIIIAANGPDAFAQTCNFAAACGWVQYTPPTYKAIDKAYPKAKIIDDFETGAADHLNSMKAAILLYDYNLAGLIKSHGAKIVDDPKLEEYLAAAYNGAPSRVNQSLKASIAENLSDWIGKLLPETKGYLAKIRFLQNFD